MKPKNVIGRRHFVRFLDACRVTIREVRPVGVLWVGVGDAVVGHGDGLGLGDGLGDVVEVCDAVGLDDGSHPGCTPAVGGLPAPAVPSHNAVATRLTTRARAIRDRYI